MYFAIQYPFAVYSVMEDLMEEQNILYLMEGL